MCHVFKENKNVASVKLSTVLTIGCTMFYRFLISFYLFLVGSSTSSGSQNGRIFLQHIYTREYQNVYQENTN